MYATISAAKALLRQRIRSYVEWYSEEEDEERRIQLWNTIKDLYKSLRDLKDGKTFTE